MTYPVSVHTRSTSRYDLLPAMARELAEAFRGAGFPVDPPPQDRAGPGGAMVLWFNMLSNVSEAAQMRAWAPERRVALVQFFVDHPFALWAEQMDHLARLDCHRLVLPCADSFHLLRLRWPTLRPLQCLHGVAPEALADAASIERGHLGGSDDDAAHRPDGVAVLGSIHAERELADLRDAVPARCRRGCDDAADILLRHPWTTFEQALDITLGCDGVITGDWAVASSCWRYVTASVNRRRRTTLVAALQGLPVAVYGGDAWKEFCVGTIAHRGNLAYSGTPRALARAKVCLAWGPTQFTHTFSERLLLSLGAGCATVADDRLLVRRHFAAEGMPEMLALVSAAEPDAARAAAEALLADAPRRAAMGQAGRAEVEANHLWAHRVRRIDAAARDAMAGANPVLAAVG